MPLQSAVAVAVAAIFPASKWVLLASVIFCSSASCLGRVMCGQLGIKSVQVVFMGWSVVEGEEICGLMDWWAFGRARVNGEGIGWLFSSNSWGGWILGILSSLIAISELEQFDLLEWGDHSKIESIHVVSVCGEERETSAPSQFSPNMRFEEGGAGSAVLPSIMGLRVFLLRRFSICVLSATEPYMNNG